MRCVSDPGWLQGGAKPRTSPYDSEAGWFDGRPGGYPVSRVGILHAPNGRRRLAGSVARAAAWLRVATSSFSRRWCT